MVERTRSAIFFIPRLGNFSVIFENNCGSSLCFFENLQKLIGRNSFLFGKNRFVWSDDFSSSDQFRLEKIAKKWSNDEKSSDHISLDCQKSVKKEIAELNTTLRVIY
jgi:hypothetical protein